jgi:hypothetical protein
MSTHPDWKSAMTRYRHRLQFGSFITPANTGPTRTVGLAVLSEQVARLGLH